MNSIIHALLNGGRHIENQKKRRNEKMLQQYISVRKKKRAFIPIVLIIANYSTKGKELVRSFLIKFIHLFLFKNGHTLHLLVQNAWVLQPRFSC